MHTTTLAATASAAIAGVAASPRSELIFQRLELKYLVDRATRTALARDLVALMRPDPYAGPDGFYRVRSLYLDTPDYLCYHDKLAGVPVRHKLRIRSYGDASGLPSRVRLEVKSRYLTYVHKTSADITLDEYRELELALRREAPSAGHRASHREFFRLQRLYNMEPKILVQYRRQALQRMEGRRIRVNFDDDVVATRSLSLIGPLRGARPMLQYGHAIFEIKVDGVLPSWLHLLITKYDLRNDAISKYCHAVRSHARLSASRAREG